MVLFYPTCIYKDPPLVPSPHLASNTAPSSRRLVPLVSTGCPAHTSPNCFRPCNCCQRERRALQSREALTPATAAVVFVPLSLIFLSRFCVGCECCSATLKVDEKEKKRKEKGFERKTNSISEKKFTKWATHKHDALVGDHKHVCLRNGTQKPCFLFSSRFIDS